MANTLIGSQSPEYPRCQLRPEGKPCVGGPPGHSDCCIPYQPWDADEHYRFVAKADYRWGVLAAICRELEFDYDNGPEQAVKAVKAVIAKLAERNAEVKDLEATVRQLTSMNANQSERIQLLTATNDSLERSVAARFAELTESCTVNEMQQIALRELRETNKNLHELNEDFSEANRRLGAELAARSTDQNSAGRLREELLAMTRKRDEYKFDLAVSENQRKTLEDDNKELHQQVAQLRKESVDNDAECRKLEAWNSALRKDLAEMERRRDECRTNADSFLAQSNVQAGIIAGLHRQVDDLKSQPGSSATLRALLTDMETNRDYWYAEVLAERLRTEQQAEIAAGLKSQLDAVRAGKDIAPAGPETIKLTDELCAAVKTAVTDTLAANNVKSAASSSYSQLHRIVYYNEAGQRISAHAPDLTRSLLNHILPHVVSIQQIHVESGACIGPVMCGGQKKPGDKKNE